MYTIYSYMVCLLSLLLHFPDQSSLMISSLITLRAIPYMALHRCSHDYEELIMLAPQCYTVATLVLHRVIISMYINCYCAS